MKWQEPPPETGRRYGAPQAWVEEAARLRENPGRWALLAEDLSERQAVDVAANIRRGRLVAFRPGRFEARSHKGSVWAR